MITEISLKRALILIKDLNKNIQEEFSRENLYKSNIKVSLFSQDLTPINDDKKLENILSIKESNTRYNGDIISKISKFEKELKKISSIKISILKANIENGVQLLINEMDLKKGMLERYTLLKNQDISISTRNGNYWGAERKEEDFKDLFIIKKEKCISDIELDTKIKQLKKDIREIENEITELNSKIKIKVEIDEGDL